MAKAKLGDGGTSGAMLLFWCPGCNETHQVPVDESKSLHWNWNGDLDLPIVTPSIAVTQTLYGPDRLTFSNYEGPHPPSEVNTGMCHSHVGGKDSDQPGHIWFWPDSTHALAGQLVPLPDF